MLWGIQHWTVCSDRQANLVQAVHGGRRWCDWGSVHALWGLAVNLGQVCLYCIPPEGHPLSSIPELRWHLFCKYMDMAESEKLPLSLGALKQHILRAHVQARVWGQAAVPQQELLDPMENGYHRDSDDGQLQPATTDVPPAPEPIVEMVRCQCKGNCSSNRCSCKSKNLPCTT